MAFDASSLNLILGSVGGGAIALYEYSTPDMIIDVVGLEYFTAITAHRLRVDDLVLVTAEDETAIVQIISVSEDGNATATFVGKEDAVLSTKSPIIDWEDRIALVLGTSIPHQGGDIDSYHGLMGEALGFDVINNAWAGSRARYDPNYDPFDIAAVKTLSMTEDDRQAGLALYGPTSAYDDSFDTINKASQMTVDYRIKAEFAANDISVVFLDHNHNDRLPPYGTLDPPSSAIGGITKGVTTTITLSTPGIFAVGDAIAIRVTGIAKLDYFAGRVQSVAGNAVTVNVDSSGFAGSFTSGTAYKYDRNTLYGAFEFIISYINWAAVLYGRTVTIILSGAPSAYTNGAFDAMIRGSSEAIRDVADKWGLAYFDVEREMAIDERSQIIYLSDNVHPLERPERQVIANYWARWGSGGAIRRLGDYEFLRAGSETFTEDREAFYTKFKDGFTTPPIIQAAAVNVFTDDFAAGLGGWTLSGSGTLPTTVAAPWNAAETAAYCISNGSDTSYLAKTGLVLDKGVALQFDAYLPEVSGLTTAELPATVQIAQFRVPGAYYSIQMIVRQTSVSWRVQYFETPNTTLRTVTSRTIRLVAATKYTVRFEYYRGEAGYPGGVYMTVNGVRVTFPDDIADSGQPVASELWLGVTSCNTGLPFPLYLGNVTLDKRAVQDFTLRGTGVIRTLDGKDLTVVNGIVTAIAAGTYASGTYTPTLTLVSNLDAATANASFWTRTGDVVSVSGIISVNATAAATTELGISLPIASNFGTFRDCAGVAFAPTSSGMGAAIGADAANDRAEMEWVAVALGAHNMHFNFSYRVI